MEGAVSLLPGSQDFFLPMLPLGKPSLHYGQVFLAHQVVLQGLGEPLGSQKALGEGQDSRCLSIQPMEGTGTEGEGGGEATFLLPQQIVSEDELVQGDGAAAAPLDRYVVGLVDDPDVAVEKQVCSQLQLRRSLLFTTLLARLELWGLLLTSLASRSITGRRILQEEDGNADGVS